MAKYKLIFNVLDLENGGNIVPKSQIILKFDETKQKPDFFLENVIKSCFLEAYEFSIPLLIEGIRKEENHG